MRACLVLVALVLSSCASKQAPPATTPPVVTPPPTTVAPPPPPAPAGQWCWISEPRKSGCTVEKAQCQKDADEMRARPDTKIASECTQQSPVQCYVFADEPTPLCYASLGDCNDGRARMADFGTTTECQPKP